MQRHDYRARRPTLESLEDRDLPSGIIASLANHSRSMRSNFIAAQAQSSSDQPAAQETPPFSPLLGQGTPTPHEQARERFRAVFIGPYTISPGRFSDQSQIVFIRGVGGSTFFLHGNIVFGVAVEKDPTNTSFGAATLNDKNVNSSGTLGLDLTVAPNGLDSQGRPTLMTFKGDSNVYSGIFFVNTSSGTVTVQYKPSSGGPKAPHAMARESPKWSSRAPCTQAA